jgi:uncharacterized oxidoreductase
MDISGNTVFIPGATSGIGLALALALQASGNTVIVGGRRTELLERIAAGHPGLDTVPVDTTDAASIDSAAKEVLARHPDLNVLVTMAGIMRIEDWHQPGSFLASAKAVMPLDEFVTEVMALLESRPEANEVQVEREKLLRYGEARGHYDQVVQTLNASDPHGN